VDERAVAGAAAARRALGANDAEDRQVVLQARDTGLGRGPDHGADVVDLAIALGALAEHDVGVLGARDVRRAEWQGHGVEGDAVKLNALPELGDVVDLPLGLPVRGRHVAADVLDAELGEVLQHLIGRGPALTANFHEGELALRWSSGAFTAEGEGTDAS